MNAIEITIISIVIIFAATTLGSSLVFFVRKKMSDKVFSLILGFASGIMIAAGFFGLLIPSIETAKEKYENIALLPVLLGFLLGGLLLYGLDKLIPHLHKYSENEEGKHTDNLSRQIKFFLAVSIHNIPEGLSVGFACGLALFLQTPAAIMSALSLAIGISIQNIPEGSAISIPMYEETQSKAKSFFYGMGSGIVEPVFALVGLLIASNIEMLMPWLLAFSAGAMIYVTIDELLPSARKGNYDHFGIWAFMFGFSIMMALEILL